MDLGHIHDNTPRRTMAPEQLQNLHHSPTTRNNAIILHHDAQTTRHFTQSLYDVSPLFSKAGPDGGARGGLRARDSERAPSNLGFGRLSKA